MSEYWSGVVDTIFYFTQFERELDERVVEKISRALLNEPIGTLTPEQEYAALAEGLRSNAPLPTLVAMPQLDSELRDFLARVVTRLDELRPWPELPFAVLPDDHLDRFQGARPMARIHLSERVVQERLGRAFHASPDGAFLPLRLRSGAVIGLFCDVWDDSDDVMLASASSELEPEQIARELAESSRIARGEITLLTADDVAATIAGSRYETTPIQQQFRGEDQPGNAIWGGKHVRYLGAEERREFELSAHDGRLYNGIGLPYDTAAARTLWTPQGGRAIFVMDEYGTVYSAPYHLLGEFHHSSFLAGAPAAGAGEIAVREGEVLLISDQSSHYRPARRFTAQVVDSLRNQGLDTSSIRIEYHSPP
ncbi:hypothetical protein [Nocardia asteroides]|uniref:hypothetical protein n=1 Tax=Nocardia asteroides TaxID=1824 RepID=UPI001E3971C4|nr:hypothetical protein [Nocardia asteroides]UGT59975.1 hypothetical protein LTT61_22495 [Nocardia asteroides]